MVYGEPLDSDKEFARQIMNLTMPARLQKMKRAQYDREGDGVELQEAARSSALEQKIELFLCVFNGSWRKSKPSDLVHYCHLNCRCGGRRGIELGNLAAELYIEVILAGRPSVPALSRWLKCAKTAKWFLPLVSPGG